MSYFLALSAAAAASAAAPGRPSSSKGTEAKTLVIYSETRTAYSLADSLESLNMRLRRVATRLEAVSANTVSSNSVTAADYLVVYCPQSNPVLPTNLVSAIARAAQPVLWIGFGADKLAELSPFKGQFSISAFSTGAAVTNVNYGGRAWNVTIDPWIPVTLGSNSAVQVLMSFEESGNDGAVTRPICWQSGHVRFFAAEPAFGPLGYLFEDLLLDFFEVKNVPPSSVFLRIEDYHCRRNHNEFRRLVDFLRDRGHPFIVAVVPATPDPATGRLGDLDSQPEFVAALRYAQQRGGRLIMHGYAHEHKAETGEGHEFWDVGLDRPFSEDTPGYTRERLHKGVRQMLKHGLFPLAWETPHYAASAKAYAEIAKVFSTAIERVQLSDATHQAAFDGASPTVDRFGRFILPENLGYVLDAPIGAFAGIKARGELITRLRGTVAGCFIHPYQPLKKFSGLVETLEEFELPFLDLADLDHWVQLPDALLVTGNAQRTVTLRSTSVRWKAFDRSGNLLAEKEEPAASGERTFKRTGEGDLELFEFAGGSP